MRKTTLAFILGGSFLLTLAAVWFKRPVAVPADPPSAQAIAAPAAKPVVATATPEAVPTPAPALAIPEVALRTDAPRNDGKTSQQASAQYPKAVLSPGERWFVTGSGAQAGIYSSELDHSAGETIVRLMSIRDVPKDTFGAMVQTVSAEPYVGKRVRLTATVSTIGATDSAGIWFRADSTTGSVAFANTLVPEETLTGHTGWTDRSIVLDIPPGAVRLNYGSAIAGAGEVRMQKVKIEVVDPSVPVTVRGPAR
jgi:hypothetical protein